MKGCAAIRPILASYRDAAPDERARADAHLKGCPQCAARLAAFDGVDAALGGLPQPALPLGLTRPLPAVLANAGRPGKAGRPSAGALGFVFRGLAPAGVILFLVIALSAVVWSVNSVKSPVTSTPTLTSTFTPTTIATRQAAVRFQPVPTGFAVEFGPEPTPAPIPAPVAQPHTAALLVGYAPHAKITN